MVFPPKRLASIPFTSSIISDSQVEMDFTGSCTAQSVIRGFRWIFYNRPSTSNFNICEVMEEFSVKHDKSSHLSWVFACSHGQNSAKITIFLPKYWRVVVLIGGTFEEEEKKNFAEYTFLLDVLDAFLRCDI